VTSLNGEPESGVTVRAVARPSGDKCAGSMEESESGADGYFRIRGLRPGCQYDIAVRVGAQRFSHVSPELVTVTTKEEDTEGFKFIAFRQLSTFDLSGNVVTPNEFLPFIKVRANDRSSYFLCMFFFLLQVKLNSLQLVEESISKYGRIFARFFIAQGIEYDGQYKNIIRKRFCGFVVGENH